ncbi:MAG: histidine phosphatase family protein [Spongiibacteraceae bacterium]
MHTENPQNAPDTLWIVRHGQSAGNVARDRAEELGLPLIDIAIRDADVPLSSVGEEQAIALGRWFRNRPPDQRPSAFLCSPYLRARRTAELIQEHAGLMSPDSPLLIDERLREKEFGVLDRYTRVGIRERFPELAEQRAHVGKFYFRPPGGESWCDVILRLRSVIDTLTRDFHGERVFVVGHQVIVNCFRCLLENLDEQTILDIDRRGDVPNCAMTTYRYDPAAAKHGALVLREVNFVAPLLHQGAAITTEPDVPAAPNP